MASSHNFWLFLFLVAALPGGACHSTRTVPQALSVQELAPVLPQQLRAVILTGKVYRQQDSTMAVPGLEFAFRPLRPDSAARGWRDVTKADGGYAVTIRAGQQYRMAWSKDGQHGETELFAVDESPLDTSRRTFYVQYVDNCCSDSVYSPALYFDTNSAALRPSSLARALPFLRQFTSPAAQAPFAWVVVGHAEPFEVPWDYPNKARYLQQLALKRALNTCRYLHALGIARERLYAISRGDQLPALPNTSPEYRQLNRRVEVRQRYLPNALALDPAASYEALVQRASKSTARPKTFQGKGRVVPVHVPPKATQ